MYERLPKHSQTVLKMKQEYLAVYSTRTRNDPQNKAPSSEDGVPRHRNEWKSRSTNIGSRETVAASFESCFAPLG